MTVLSRLVGRLANLPPAKTHAVFVERDLKIAMPDGVLLLADHYVPRGSERPPTILVRCPYGRRGFFGLLYGHLPSSHLGGSGARNLSERQYFAQPRLEIPCPGYMR